MFGQQDNQNDNQQIPDQSIEGALNDAPTEEVVAGAEQTDSPAEDQAAPAPSTPDPIQDVTQPSGDPADWQHPGMPLDPDHADAVAAAVPKPTYSAPANPSDGEPTYTANDLLDIKQQALQKLSPLVDQLDQPPVDRFRTLMMMIQASDDQTLVKEAFEVANQIEDEKAKAQALLDIVNEINYFTAQHPEA